MKLPPLRDTFERKLTLGETLLWAGIFFGGLILFFIISPFLFAPLLPVIDYFFPMPPNNS